ncbi:MAG: polyphosphate polymerase domain-containing protein [Eubacteriales bacterium]|nr:polyphosphate polymerase domain-containing protein [Eubacteriales bacterium]
MADITVFQRHEKKFLMDVETMERILPEIKKHMDPDKYCQNGRTYAISNLYFDTENNDVIRESLQKPFYKEKLRMRCYGVPKNDQSQVFLEIKKKVNKVVTKRRVKLTYGEAKLFLYYGIFPETDDYMTNQVLKEIQYYLTHKNVYASTRISYDRHAFFDREDSSFRLTFDENLFYLKGECPDNIKDFIKGLAKPGGVNYQDSRKGKRIIPEHLRLMEVKVSNAYPMWFARLLSDDGIFATSFSKYGVSYKHELLNDESFDSEMFDVLSHI